MKQTDKFIDAAQQNQEDLLALKLEMADQLRILVSDLICEPKNPVGFDRTATRICEILDIGRCEIFSARPQDKLVELLGSSNLLVNRRQLCRQLAVDFSGLSRILKISIKHPSRNVSDRCTWYPIEKSGELLGGVLVCRRPRHQGHFHCIGYLVRWLEEILASLHHAKLIRRQEKYEERANISRELHDSLAQSLTYLKIQVTRLRSIIDKTSESGIDPERLRPVVSELQSQLNASYRQLKELMTTFRLTMHGRTFNEAIEESVHEFADRSTVEIELVNHLPADCLQVNEEMQVLQIIREALSNIVRHSRAQKAVVSIHNSSGRAVSIRISDDGIGMPPEQGRTIHHGLLIMEERCDGLNGKFNIDSSETHGTTIHVTFPKIMHPA